MNTSNTVAEIVAEINRLSGGTLKPTAFKTKALALARLAQFAPKLAVPAVKTSEKEPKKVAKAAKKAAKKTPTLPVPLRSQRIAVPLVATPEEVRELQAIRDLRLSGRDYMNKKISFFERFRNKYQIPATGTRIKVETEDVTKLGAVQWCDSNEAVTVRIDLKS